MCCSEAISWSWYFTVLADCSRTCLAGQDVKEGLERAELTAPVASTIEKYRTVCWCRKGTLHTQLCCVSRQQLWLHQASMQLQSPNSNRRYSTDQTTLKDMRCVHRHAARSLAIAVYLQLAHHRLTSSMQRRARDTCMVWGSMTNPN